jgi:hypothetical protein
LSVEEVITGWRFRFEIRLAQTQTRHNTQINFSNLKKERKANSKKDKIKTKRREKSLKISDRGRSEP